MGDLKLFEMINARNYIIFISQEIFIPRIDWNAYNYEMFIVNKNTLNKLNCIITTKCLITVFLNIYVRSILFPILLAYP